MENNCKDRNFIGFLWDGEFLLWRFDGSLCTTAAWEALPQGRRRAGLGSVRGGCGECDKDQQEKNQNQKNIIELLFISCLLGMISPKLIKDRKNIKIKKKYQTFIFLRIVRDDMSQNYRKFELQYNVMHLQWLHTGADWRGLGRADSDSRRAEESSGGRGLAGSPSIGYISMVTTIGRGWGLG